MTAALTRISWAVVAVTLSAAPVLAQARGSVEDAPPPPAAELEAAPQPQIFLDADGFRALFEGKTVHLSAQGRYFGSEYYKKGDRSLWIRVGQPCMPGVWYYEEPYFCFQYGADGPHCWTVYRRGESLYAMSIDGFELKIDAVDERPLSCGEDLLS